MKKRKPLQSDLFITPPPQTEWPALQRAKALALLEALLAEANGADVEQGTTSGLWLKAEPSIQGRSLASQPPQEQYRCRNDRKTDDDESHSNENFLPLCSTMPCSSYW